MPIKVYVTLTPVVPFLTLFLSLENIALMDKAEVCPNVNEREKRDTGHPGNYQPFIISLKNWRGAEFRRMSVLHSSLSSQLRLVLFISECTNPKQF